MTKFEQFIKQLEKKKEFKVPKESQEFAEIRGEYDRYVKEGFLKSPKTVTTSNVKYLVYKASKKAEKYFKNEKRKTDKGSD